MATNNGMLLVFHPPILLSEAQKGLFSNQSPLIELRFNPSHSMLRTLQSWLLLFQLDYWAEILNRNNKLPEDQRLLPTQWPESVAQNSKRRRFHKSSCFIKWIDYLKQNMGKFMPNRTLENTSSSKLRVTSKTIGQLFHQREPEIDSKKGLLGVWLNLKDASKKHSHLNSIRSDCGTINAPGIIENNWK